MRPAIIRIRNRGTRAIRRWQRCRTWRSNSGSRPVPPARRRRDAEQDMKLGLINSAWVQAQQPTVFGLGKTKEIGFDTVDIFVDPLDLDVRERRLIKDECDRLELPIISLPC